MKSIGTVALTWGLAALVGISPGSGAALPLAAECQPYALRDLRPGQRFQEVRKRLGTKWRSLRPEAGARGSETSLTYLDFSQSTTVLFDQSPVVESSAKVLSIRVCTTTPGAGALTLLNGSDARWGAPFSGRENLDQAQQNGPTVWRSTACALELEAFRRPREWWEQSNDALCVELRGAPAAPQAETPPVAATIEEPLAASVASDEGDADAPLLPVPLNATPAKLLSSVTPAYPATAARSTTVARVVVNATVTETGTIDGPRVVESTVPGEGFEAAAIAAIEQWRYEPATQSGRPVAQQIKIVVEFR